MCLCFNLYGRFHRHIIELCWLKSNNYGVLRGLSSNTKVAPSLGSHSKTISRPSLHLLVIRAVLLGLEFHLRVLILLVQAKTSHIPDLQGVEIHPKVEGLSVSSVRNRGTNRRSVERLPGIETRLFYGEHGGAKLWRRYSHLWSAN